MTVQSLDLIHELQGELGWDSEFATTAHSEYVRWLRLRAQAGDFKYCKLPPSRVVATVWSLHRQWTLDYESTCSNLGGFIHHFPPAMRMNLPREQAYAATVHTYKNMYKEDPPATHWGPTICPYKPLSSSAFPFADQGAQDPPPRALPSLRRSPAKRDASLAAPATPTKQKTRVSGDPSSRRASAAAVPSLPGLDKSRFTSDPFRPRQRSSKSAKDGKNLIPDVEDTILDGGGQSPRTPGKPKKRLSGPSALYVLRPLRPGEKRKRGRPSFSDYVLAADSSQPAASTDPKKKDPKSPVEKPTTPKAGSAAHSARRRKTVAVSPGKAPTVAPTIVKREKGHKPFRRVARSSANTTISDAKVAAPSVAAGTTVVASKATQPEPEGKDGAAPVKRPRGRPRKDGSWPVARTRRAEPASKASAPAAQKPTVPSVSTDKPKDGPGGAPKDTSANANEPRPGASTSLPVVTSAQPVAGAVPPSVASGGLPVATPSTSLAVVSSATTAVVPTSAPPQGPQVPAVPMSSPMQSAMQPKQVNPVENMLVHGTIENAPPSKIVEGRDLQMHDLTDKEASKPQSVAENMPRDAVFEQIIDGSGLGDKERQVDMTNPLVGKDVRIAQDVVFPQSEAIRDPADMDMSLGAVSRPDNLSGIPGAPVHVNTHNHQGGEKLMPQANTFSMAPMNVSQVSNPLGGGMLAMGAAPDVPRPNADDGDKDEDMHMEDGDPKKPFKRPRGRPRKDGSWPVQRPKGMNEEAVERVKDLNDPPLNFPMGPSGTV